MAKRILASRKILNFTQFTFPTYIPDPFHVKVAEALDLVISGDIKRLMIFAPPQHGKSELVSIRLPAFWLGNHPDTPVILTSYGGSLAFRNSRAARSVVEDTLYTQIFPGIETDPNSRAVDRWKLFHHRGFAVAAGVGGPITGHGAGLGIIDDPVQSWAQAQSKTLRDSVWEWYQGTFRTRIWEGGSIVLIMTRWHEDDLAGRLLRDQPGQWRVLHFPALADDPVNDLLGRDEMEPLSPSRFSQAELLSIKQDVGPTVWSAEYQGRPTPPEGGFFAIGEINYIETPPPDEEITRVVRYWDLAATEEKQGRDPDYTVGTLMGVTKSKRFVWLDIHRGRWSANKVEEEVLKTALRDRASYGKKLTIKLEQEPGAAGKALAEHYIALLAGFNVKAERGSGSKPVRAQPLAAQVEGGRTDMVLANWNNTAIDEMLYFPAGAHDDIVDSSSGSFNELAAKPRWASIPFLHLGSDVSKVRDAAEQAA